VKPSKSQITNYKYQTNYNDQNYKFKTCIANIEAGKQLIKASGSVCANYREANESLSEKDFMMRIKICRKEAKALIGSG
jgi:four helix bundle protein